MDASEGTTPDDLWTPYKELVAVVDGYLASDGRGPTYAVHTFEAVLRRHKQTFLSILKYPAKNAASREEIKRGMTEGVVLPSTGRTLLSKELVDEAIIISDMYNVHEYLALELLHTACRQQPLYPGLPRGLLAVLLLCDGRRSVAHALRELAMCVHGVCWSVTAREEIVNYVSRYVEQLISDGLLGNILDALRNSSLQDELELLQNNRALPPPRHYGRLVSTIHSTRKLLAGVVFAAAAQRGLPRDVLMRLLNEQSSSPPQLPLDDVSLALQMALLYALDLSVLHRREDGEELAASLPLLSCPDLLPALLDELCPAQGDPPPGDKANGTRALCQLALGLALAALKRGPQSLLRRGSPAEIKVELLDQDELLVDTAIDGKVFEYLDEAILSSATVCQEEYYQRRLHSLYTDFIVLMHSKLMEMRVKADEASRAVQMYASEGLTAPEGAGACRARLESLLRGVERLYSSDPRGLRHEYWSAAEQQPPASHQPMLRSGGRAATLYKFVRLPGELVCATLLPAYLRALASLAVERHTWALLARRDALSAHHLLTALARYHSNLRTDHAPFSLQLPPLLGGAALAGGGARPGRLLVRHEEVEAMAAALVLIASVARQDTAAASAIAENLQWDAVNVMFGLICCHIPLHLKAELCLTLAALGGTPSTAPRVWAALEAAQLVTAARDKRALHADLTEVECRLEEYPLSRAFLTLLDSLCSAAPLPRALGAGARPPGLDPYLDHALNMVALPAPHRPYASPHEKWQVLTLCFRVFARWLDAYEPSAADFPPPDREPETNPPPGLRLALLLHSSSELLRLLLGILDEAHLILQAPPPLLQPPTEWVSEALVLALRMLERGLAMERALAAAAAAAARPVLLLPLSKLILAAEGSLGARLVTCCRLLQHVASHPLVAARAAQLLLRALQAPAVARHLLPALTSDHATATDIRHGFVECLEAEECGDTEAVAALRQTKESVLMLLQQTLPTAAPNLAHYLLGYHLNEDPSCSVLRAPGAAGAPRTCLHSILDILEQHIAARDRPDRVSEAPDLVESCYRLVYWLVARPVTSGPALRLLRSRDHFLARHVKAIVPLESASVVTLSARSWLLRACACELGAAAASRQHAALSALLTALTHTAHHPTQEWEWCLLRRTLEGLPVTVQAAPEPRWELFNALQLRQAIASCDVTTGVGGKRISVNRVHALLARELASLHATAPQRNLVMMEIQKVLDYVTEINKQRNLAATLSHYYDSWRQLTEILFCVAPQDILNLDSRKNLLLNILQDLLNKIPPAEVLPQIGNLASGTILLLLVNLRHCYILQKRDTSLKTSDFETTFFGPSNQIMQTNSLTLKFILHKILSWILVSGGCTQKMRVNLYGALLNYLNIVNLKPSPADPESEAESLDADSTYVSRLDASRGRPPREEAGSGLKNMVVDVVGGFGDNLCNIVCSDCIGAGHDVCRMVALSCLDTLLEINPRSEWMGTLTNQGYLRSLVDSLLADDEPLAETLEPQPKSLRVLYVYESKLALLIKIAGTRRGAEVVLQAGALSCLAQLRALHSHPDVHAPSMARDTDFVPCVANRFRQILVPALALCDAILTTLGTQNHSAVIHVTHFLLSHVECIDCVLRAAHPNSPEGLLIELEAITSVIARASNREVFGLAIGEDTALQASAAGVQRIQSLVLALLPRFRQPPPYSSQPEASPRLYYKIVCNLLTYARNILELEGSRGVLSPHVAADSGPSCGAVLQLLGALSGGAAERRKAAATARHQLRGLPACTADDIKKLLPADAAHTAPAEARAAAVSLLRSRVRLRRLELQYCTLAVEGALYLVWAHARIYLRATIGDGKTVSDALTPAGAWRGAGGDDLPELRKALVAVFNDRFTDDLLETSKSQPAAHRGFIDVLVKDIKSMIQFSTL